jgi:hypothetical protein
MPKQLYGNHLQAEGHACILRITSERVPKERADIIAECMHETGANKERVERWIRQLIKVGQIGRRNVDQIDYGYVACPGFEPFPPIEMPETSLIKLTDAKTAYRRAAIAQAKRAEELSIELGHVRRTLEHRESALANLTAELHRAEALAKPLTRRKLPDEREGKTKVFRLLPSKQGEKILRIYVTTGLFDDGTLGEIFVKADRQGATISGLLNQVAIHVSMSLQFGVPLQTIVRQMRGTRFEPSGFLFQDEKIKHCSSVADLIARHLEMKFLKPEPEVPSVVEVKALEFPPTETTPETKGN